MACNLVLAGIVSNESIYVGLFLLFVAAPAVLIGSIFATIRTKSWAVPVSALIGGAVGLVYLFFDGPYGDSVSNKIFSAFLMFVAFSFPGAAFGLLVLLGIQIWGFPKPSLDGTVKQFRGEAVHSKKIENQPTPQRLPKRRKKK